MINSTKTMNSLVDKMAWQVARGERLSQNISNMETPGYKRIDIKPFEIANRHHDNPHRTLAFQNIESSEPITREGEMMQMAENVAGYQTNLQLFKKYLGLLKTVIGGRSG